MKYPTIIISFVLIISLLSCTNEVKQSDEKQKVSDENIRISYVYQNDEQTKSVKKRGAVIAKVSTVALGKALQSAIKEGGPEQALTFCNHQAIKITDSLSKAEGAVIKRVAKKNRNPENEMSAVESKVFKQFLMEWLSGKTLEAKLTIDENNHPVYYKPILTTKNCLVCHGKPGKNIPENMADKIAELYPEDKAINFEDGHPRGMWVISFPEIKVNKN